MASRNSRLSKSSSNLVASQAAERPKRRNKVEIALGIGNKRIIAELEAKVDAQDFMIKGLKDTIAVKQKAADKLSVLNETLQSDLQELQTKLHDEKESKDLLEKLCREQSEEIDDLKNQLDEKHKKIPFYKKQKILVSGATATESSSIKNSRCMPEIATDGTNIISSEDSRASDNDQDQLPLDETRQAVVARKKSKFWPLRLPSKRAPKEKKPEPKKSKKKNSSFIRLKSRFTAVELQQSSPSEPAESNDGPIGQYGTQAECNRAQLLKRQMEESTKRSLAVVLDTEQIGAVTLENLEGQHEQLNRIERKRKGMLGDQEKEVPPKQKKSPKLSRALKTPPGSPKPRQSGSSKPSEQPPLQQGDLPSTGRDVVEENLVQIGNVLNVLKDQAIATGAAIDRNNEQILRNKVKLDHL